MPCCRLAEEEPHISRTRKGRSKVLLACFNAITPRFLQEHEKQGYIRPERLTDIVIHRAAPANAGTLLSQLHRIDEPPPRGQFPGQD